MNLSEKRTTPVQPIFTEESDYEQAHVLFVQGHHLYTEVVPSHSDWRYESALSCFKRAVQIMTGRAKTEKEHQLLRRSQYYLYKTYYGHTRRGGQLGRRLNITSVEAGLAGSPVRRHRAAVWLVEHLGPCEKIGIKLLDLFDRIHPSE